jgi:hypothetical protein
MPRIMSEWKDLDANAVYYGMHLKRNILTTRLYIYSADFHTNELVNRVIKSLVGGKI